MFNLVNYLKAMKEFTFSTERRNSMPCIKSVLTEHGYIVTLTVKENEIFLMISFDLCIRVDCGSQISRKGLTKLSNI